MEAQRNNPIRIQEWSCDLKDADALVTREWLVTNGLGGYASGTVSGVSTRRYHGLLIAALPSPFGRTVMLDHLCEQIRLPDGKPVLFGGEELMHRGLEQRRRERRGELFFCLQGDDRRQKETSFQSTLLNSQSTLAGPILSADSPIDVGHPNT